MAPSLTTAQRWVPNDVGDRSPPRWCGNLAGTVSFTLYALERLHRDRRSTAHGRSRSAGAGLPQTVSTSNTTAITATGTFSWKVSYDSTNPAQADIAASCHEVSNLTINNNAP